MLSRPIPFYLFIFCVPCSKGHYCQDCHFLILNFSQICINYLFISTHLGSFLYFCCSDTCVNRAVIFTFFIGNIKVFEMSHISHSTPSSLILTGLLWNFPMYVNLVFLAFRFIFFPFSYIIKFVYHSQSFFEVDCAYCFCLLCLVGLKYNPFLVRIFHDLFCVSIGKV